MTRFFPAMSFSVLLVAAASASADDRAAKILAETGVRGGLVVHVGCGGSAELTSALRASDSFLVQGLDADPDAVEEARELVRAKGLYGPVSIDHWRGPRLPYADGLVQLIVAERLGDVSRSEVLRVLSPEGVAWIGGTKIVKPRPTEVDEWTHYLHGPDNNATASDALVGQPRRMQWTAGPRWSRSHDHLASTSAVVSSGGRVFSIVDEGSIAHIALPPRWNLVARDAFSGVLLWKRPIASWEGHMRNFRSGPTELPRRLVAVGDRVYVTLGYGQPVTALDAATGETLTTYAETNDALEILCDAGTLLVVAGDREPDNADGAAVPNRPKNVWHWWPIYGETPPKKRIVAIDVATGNLLWKKTDADAKNLMPTTLATAAGRVFFQSPDHLIALDKSSGKELWRAPRPTSVDRPTWSAPTLVVSDGVVLSADRSAPASAAVDRRGNPTVRPNWRVDAQGGGARGQLIAFSAETGKRLWSSPCRETYNAPPDVLVVDGVVWTGDLVGAGDPGITEGRDPHTGEVVRTRERDQTQFKTGMHHRCYRNKATDRFLILGRDGMAFIDLEDGRGFQNEWVRGACQYGIMPCNGLTYVPNHSCACNITTKLDSFLALSSQPAGEPTSDDERLRKGPAYGEPTSPAAKPDDWPTYRADAARSGRAAGEGPSELGVAWRCDALKGHRLSSPVLADGRFVFAARDTHQVIALDAATGEPLWSFTAGGRVDSPPTLFEGLVLFGSTDGRVYCLRADDGRLVWSYLAAAEDRRVVVYDQVESVGPVCGSVLVQDGTAYSAAGRSTFLDGGIWLCGLDPATGRQKLRRRVEEGGLPDVLSGDGESIFMRHLRFGPDGDARSRSVPHLYSPAGFLDGSWWHRTYWLVGVKIGERWGGWSGAGNTVPAGRLLVVDGKKTYGFGRMGQYHNHGAHAGLGRTRYQLYACSPAEKPGGKTRPAVHWSADADIDVRAMTLAGESLYVAGSTNFFAKVDATQKHPYFLNTSAEAIARQDRAVAGKEGGLLIAVDATDGTEANRVQLTAPPVFDGLIVAAGRVYVCQMDGRIVCLGVSDR